MITKDPEQFALRVRELAEAMKADMNKVVRSISIDLLSSVVKLSPVGNPELWAANAHAMYARETHNLWVDAANASLKPGEKRERHMGRRRLKQTYKLRAGQGYVGGRFKSNWVVSRNGPSDEIRDAIDASGALSVAIGTNLLQQARAGDVIWIQNSLPYSVRLEYGWSTQAPAGMVRVTAVRFREFIDAAIKQIRAEPPPQE